MYRKRFGLTCHPIPRDAQGPTFFEGNPTYKKLERAFQFLIADRGLGACTAEAGVGKTAAMRNLCRKLPNPDYRPLYVCDTAVTAREVYNNLARELGVWPSHSRARLWADIKKALLHMVDERGCVPVIVIDEAQHLSDAFLNDLSGFLNFAFDSRNLLTLWLVGLPAFAERLRMQRHAALAMRVNIHVHLEALSRTDFGLFIDHALKAAGATSRLLSDPALEMLLRQSNGVPRLASRLLQTTLRIAHERDQSFVDEHILDAAIEESELALGSVA